MEISSDVQLLAESLRATYRCPKPLGRNIAGKWRHGAMVRRFHEGVMEKYGYESAYNG